MERNLITLHNWSNVTLRRLESSLYGKTNMLSSASESYDVSYDLSCLIQMLSVTFGGPGGALFDGSV